MTDEEYLVGWLNHDEAVLDDLMTQYSKLILDIPKPDIAISMGCNVGCPFIGRVFDDNWGAWRSNGKEWWSENLSGEIRKS